MEALQLLLKGTKETKHRKSKTSVQAMTLGKSQYTYNFLVGDKTIEIQPTLKILGVTLDRVLSFKPHVTIMLKKAYAMIATLRRITR